MRIELKEGPCSRVRKTAMSPKHFYLECRKDVGEFVGNFDHILMLKYAYSKSTDASSRCRACCYDSDHR